MKSPNNTGQVIGLTGNAACGKDFVASVFEEFGFLHVSTSDLVRQEIARRGMVTSRQLQTQVANELRLVHGPGYLVEESVRRAETTPRFTGRLLLSGIYAVGEGVTVVDELEGTVVGVVTSTSAGADLNERYSRLVNRADGPRDEVSPEDFLAAYERENSGLNELEPNVSRLLGMARFTIINAPDMSRREIVEQVDRVIQETGL